LVYGKNYTVDCDQSQQGEEEGHYIAHRCEEEASTQNRSMVLDCEALGEDGLHR